MNFSTQLRLILLVAGGLVLLLIYLLGKRHGRVAERAEQLSLRTASPAVHDFGPATDMDEDELDTPAYLRRSQHEVRHRDDSLPTVDLPHHANLDNDPAPDLPEHDDDDQEDHWSAVEEEDGQPLPPMSAEERVEPRLDDHSFGGLISEEIEPAWRESVVIESQLSTEQVPVVVHAEPMAAENEPPTLPRITDESEIPVVQQTVTMPDVPAATANQTTSRTPPTPSTVSEQKPLSTSGDKPASASVRQTPVTKRKIVALRLSVPSRIPGEQLLSLLQREHLQHGRFDIFHRLHNDVSVFSIASMVEPGSFDLSTMRDRQYPGITFFMLLPGPLDGLIAWDQMYSCAQRLAHATEGVLQDERGHKLTAMAADRLREEVLDFQHLLGNVGV